MTEDTSAPRSPLRRYWPWVRVLILALILGGVYLWIKNTGVLEQVSPEYVRDWIAQWGGLAVAAYFFVFALGQLLYVPGLIFVLAGGLAFGVSLGLLYGMLGATIAISVSFFVVRTIGGTPLENPKVRWIRKALMTLNTRPLTSIFILRLFFSTAPWLNYILAMSRVSYREYIFASVLGFTPQVVLTVLFADWFLQYLS